MLLVVAVGVCWLVVCCCLSAFFFAFSSSLLCLFSPLFSPLLSSPVSPSLSFLAPLLFSLHEERLKNSLVQWLPFVTSTYSPHCSTFAKLFCTSHMLHSACHHDIGLILKVNLTRSERSNWFVVRCVSGKTKNRLENNLLERIWWMLAGSLCSERIIIRLSHV